MLGGNAQLPIHAGGSDGPVCCQNPTGPMHVRRHGKLDKAALSRTTPAGQAHRLPVDVAPAASVDVGRPIQNGMMGCSMPSAATSRVLGAQFETYAVQRIRGAMLDGLRENDWLPRSLRRDMRRIEAAIHSLEQQNGARRPRARLAAAH